MAENGSVGMISLDLVIKEKLTEQLDKIKARVSAPAAKVGETMQSAVEKPMKNVGKSMTDSMKQAMDDVKSVTESAQKSLENVDKDVRKVLEGASEDTANAILKQLERAKEQQKQLAETVSEVPRAVKMGGYVQYDTAKIEAHMNEVADSIGKKVKETAEKSKEALESVKDEVKDVPEVPVDTAKTVSKLSIIQKKWQELSHSAGSAFFAIKKNSGKAFGFLKNTGEKALNSLKSRFSHLGSSALSVSKPVSKLGKMLKNSFRRVFFAASIYAGFRAIKDGLLETAKADEQFSKSLAEVKQNLSVAFAPIMQAVMPALNAMMSGLASVTKQIAAFIAGLFGKTYKQAAETAKKLKGVTDAAKKAKLSLAGIDEMNILSSGDDSGTSGTDLSNIDTSEPKLPDWAEELKNKLRSGDWAGIGAMLANGINKALGSVNWDKVSAKVNGGVKKITDGINGFIDNIDWDVLGDTLAGGLNTLSGAILTFTSRVHWDKLGAGIAQGLNRAIKKTNWKQLGKSLGSIVQSIISTAYSFALNFDWSGFGNAVGDTINGWFDAVDFSQAAQTLSLGIIGVLQTASAAADRTDWLNIGKKLSDALNNIDIVGISGEFAHTLSNIITGALDLAIGFVENTKWNKLTSKLFDSLGAMLRNINWGGLVTRAFRLAGAAVAAKLTLAVTFVRKVWETIVTAFKSVASSINQKIEECGGWTIEGIYNGIKDALKNVGTWIIDHIFKPFIEGFCNAFGIASPSKVMAEMGGYLIDGLYNAVSDGIKRVTGIFTEMREAIKGVFSNIGSWFYGTFSSAWERIKSAFANSSVIKFFGGVKDDIIEAFKSIPEKLGNIFEDAYKNIKEISDKIGSTITDIVDKIPGAGKAKNVLSDAVSFGYGGILGLGAKKVASYLPFMATGGTLSRNGDAAIVGEAGPELLQLIGGKAVVTPFTSAPKLSMVGAGTASGSGGSTELLSKIQGMIGADPEVVELLRLIVELLRSGMNIEIINYMFKNSSEFSREVVKAVADNNARRGR